MKVYKDLEVSSELIKQLRKSIISEDRKTKYFLGVNSSNIISTLPIKKRDFHLWVYLVNDDIIGFITFDINDDDVAFIKAIYVLSEYRKKGFGKYIILNLYKHYPKLECRINLGNVTMYKLVRHVNMRNEKLPMSFLRKKGEPTIWWSNYHSEDDYI